MDLPQEKFRLCKNLDDPEFELTIKGYLSVEVEDMSTSYF